jgi:hypothetical protein
LLILLRVTLETVADMIKMRRSVLSIGLAGLMLLIWPASAFAATDPGLGNAAPFAILAGQSVTNTGLSVVNGNVGVSPGAAATNVTGFGGAPNGTINGVTHDVDAVALSAQSALTAAYLNAAGQTPPTALATTNLGGQTLVPGIYSVGAATLSGSPLTLNGSGIYVFQISSTLITSPGSSVVLIGAQPCQVFWQVTSSVTLDTTTTFVGTIMALTSISMNNGVLLNGRALARNGSVTLINDTINLPAACVVAGPSPTPTATPSAGTGGAVLPGNTGVPPDFRGAFPWLLLIGGGAGLVATAMVVSSRRRRRRI